MSEQKDLIKMIRMNKEDTKYLEICFKNIQDEIHNIVTLLNK